VTSPGAVTVATVAGAGGDGAAGLVVATVLATDVVGAAVVVAGQVSQVARQLALAEGSNEHKARCCSQPGSSKTPPQLGTGTHFRRNEYECPVETCVLMNSMPWQRNVLPLSGTVSSGELFDASVKKSSRTPPQLLTLSQKAVQAARASLKLPRETESNTVVVVLNARPTPTNPGSAATPAWRLVGTPEPWAYPLYPQSGAKKSGVQQLPSPVVQIGRSATLRVDGISVSPRPPSF